MLGLFYFAKTYQLFLLLAKFEKSTAALRAAAQPRTQNFYSLRNSLDPIIVRHAPALRSDRQGQPKNVGVAVKIESHAKVSYKGGRILKLSDKVTMTRAFTARKKNRPAILFFS